MSEKNPPAPRETPGDFTVGDPKLNGLLYQFANQWLNVGRDPQRGEAAGYGYRDRMVTLGAIQRLYHAHAEQAKQEAYDIGFRRGLREVGQEISAPGMTDLMVPPETIPDYQPPK